MSLVFMLCVGFGGPATAQAVSDPEVQRVLDGFRSCVEDSKALAARMKTPSLREKIFNGQVLGCERSRDAELRIIVAEGRLIELDAEIAAMTEALVAEAKSELK